MKTDAAAAQRLRFALLAISAGLPFLVTSGPYQELIRDFDAGKYTAYYEHVTTSSTPGTLTVLPSESSDDLDRIQEELLATAERWETVLARPNLPSDQDVEEMELYRELAQDSTLDQQLAQGVELHILLGLLPLLNPSVHAASEQLRATLEQFPQAAYLDNILKQYNAFTKQFDTKVAPSQQKQMVAMSFPFPGALALKGKLVSEQVEIAVRQQAIVLRDLRATMETAYHEYTFVGAAIAINRENQDLLKQMINVAQAKLRGGKATYNAIIMAQVELSKLSDTVITLEEQRATVIARINMLLNRLPDAPLGAPKPLAETGLGLPLAKLYEVAIEGKQELQQQRLRTARMNTMVELATRMAYPDPSTGAAYFENRMRLASGTGQTTPAFATRRDLNHRETPWFGQRDAYIREIKIRTGAMEKTLTAMQDRTRFEVRQAYFGLTTAKRSIALYRNSLLPQARQALEATAAAYRAGKTGFLTFLDVERTLLSFRLAERRALRDHHTQLARLDQLAGHPLPRTSSRGEPRTEDK